MEEGQEEAWVIRASGAKLLEARIDQMRRVVTISKVAHQAFTSAQWQQLRSQLAAWKVQPLAPCTQQLLETDTLRMRRFTSGNS